MTKFFGAEVEELTKEILARAEAMDIVEAFYRIQGRYTLDEAARGAPKVEMIEWLVEKKRRDENSREIDRRRGSGGTGRPDDVGGAPAHDPGL